MPQLVAITPRGRREVTYSPGSSVREILQGAGLPVRSGCTGNGACGLCLVHVEDGTAPEPTETERLNLSDEQVDSNVRLACQLRPAGDVTIRVLFPVKSRERDTPLFEAMLTAAQYLVRLKTQQDIWEHLSSLVVSHFPAAWVAFGHGLPAGSVRLHHHLPAEGCELPEALSEAAIPLVTDVLETGFLATAIIGAPASMTAFLPIQEEYQTKEVMLIGHRSVDPLPGDTLNAYLALAGLAGTTLERLHHEQERNRHRAYLEELVQERTAELAKAQRQNELILASVKEGIAGLDLEGRVTFVNPMGAELLGWEPADLIGRNAHDTFHHTPADGQPNPPSGCPVHSTLHGRRTDVTWSEEFSRRDGSRFPAELTTAPLTEEGRTVGAVIVFRDVTERKLAEEERERRLGRATVLNEVATACASSLDAEEMAGRVLGAVRRHMSAEVARLVWLDQRAGDRLGAESALAQALLTQDFVTHDQLRGQAARELLALVGNTSRRRAVILTLRVQGRGSRALVLAFDGNRPFAAEELALYRSVAAQLATALDNARLYEQTAAVANILQEALVSLPREVAGVRFGHGYRSATEAARLGGDFYDVFPLPRGRVGVLVGDVSGKGIGAASVASFTRETVRAYALHHDSPRNVLALANSALLHRHGTKQFVTACFVILDPATGRLRYSMAGHPPPVRVTARGAEVTRWEPSLPLGIMETTRYRTGRCTLGRDTTLVFYSDGITEARHDGKLFGEARLVELLRRLRGVPIEEIPAQVLAEIETFSQGRYRDDSAVLAIRLSDS